MFQQTTCFGFMGLLFMNNQQTPSVKEVIDYHLTSSLVRIASFTDYLATKIYKRDHPQDEPYQVPESLPCEKEHTEEEQQEEEPEQNL